MSRAARFEYTWGRIIDSLISVCEEGISRKKQ